MNKVRPDRISAEQRSIRLAIVGVGNCASSLVQAVTAAKEAGQSNGISFPEIGQYSITDVEFVAAFDVDSRKVGRDLSEAIATEPNCTTSYFPVPFTGVDVVPGPLLDGVAEHMNDVVLIDERARTASVDDVIRVLRDRLVDVMVLYLPVGAHYAADIYAKAAIVGRCALVNCTPAPIAASAEWSTRFSESSLVVLGDDIKSQIGSTAVHQVLLALLARKGIEVRQTYQLNIGGNTDFRNMREPSRGAKKRLTKVTALSHLVKEPLDKLGVGPSDFVPHLRDQKEAFINIEGVGMLGMPVSIDVRLKVEDSPNSAGVVINAIRLAALARNRGESGVVNEVCSALFKHPPIPVTDEEAHRMLQEYLTAPSEDIRDPVS